VPLHDIKVDVWFTFSLWDRHSTPIY